ncbi:tetratricopeptide repeat-containing sensor histidine kinase [Altibacter sp. HG106]|uniref:tetratricopeptide repeat-containing sensor histidine kinase n=1 Tax=Altibacter sp. HG106 TaxID=3023937 RepID=UPI002350BD38|nr:sensor histidine kinase [Altibacter sp. HG106]MDC7994363.1 sensor histidine kinase [Altibacter sp. HG106]
MRKIFYIISLGVFGFFLNSETLVAQEAALDSIIESYKDQAWELKYSNETEANRVLQLGLKRSRKLKRQADEGYFYRKLISQKGFNGETDSAQYYFETGMKFALRQDSLEDSGLVGKLHSEMGEMSHRNGALKEAIYHYQKADSVFRAVNDSLGITIAKLNLGNIYYVQGEYPKAIQLYLEGDQMADTTQYQYIKGTIYNSLSASYGALEDDKKAKLFAEKALETFTKEKDQYPEYMPLAYTNLAQKEQADGNYDKALALLDEMDLFIEEKGLEASKSLAATRRAKIYLEMERYAEAIEVLEATNHLLDKYRINAETDFDYHYTLGVAYVESGASQKALQTLEPLEAKADSLEMLSEVAYINDALANLYASRGDFTKAYQAQEKFQKINDSLFTLEKQRSFKEIDAKYESEKKERQLAETRADLAQRELEVKQKNALVYGGFGLAMILGLLGYLLYNQQKLKNRQLQRETELKTALARIETQNKLQEQRLRISRDLHDNIGSQLTFVTSSIENLSYGMSNQEDKVRHKLKTISEFTTQTIYELRDTIWAMNKEQISCEDLQTRIANFIDQAHRSQEQVTFQVEISPSVPSHHTFTSVQGMNTYRIIQEAVNNAMKYAKATVIGVRLDKVDDQFQVTVQDDGNGFDPSNVPLGNGLQNMKKRAHDLNGSLQLSSEPNVGTTVRLEFPTMN